jgi:spermidine synthase
VTDDGRGIEIVPDRDRPSAHTLRIDGTDQSYVDLDDPTRLEFDYIQRMADAINGHGAAGEPLRCVHIGGAGMTLPRYVAATRPRSPQVVMEPDAELTELVRERLPLPRHHGIKVRPIGGRAGVAALRDDFADLIVLDAFDGDRIPAELTTREFFADLARTTAADGLVLLNLADHAPFPYLRRAVRGVCDAFAQVVISAEPATLKGRRFGNVLVMASQAELPWQALARKAASSPFPYRVIPYQEVVETFAAKQPFTDADAERSPARPGSATFFR